MTLVVSNLHIEYPGQMVFEDVSFEVAEGETLAIHSQILDGGSSLLEAIGGRLNGVGGSIHLSDIDLLDNPPETTMFKIGYVYENHGLVSLYTVYQNIILPLQFHTDLNPSEIGMKLNHVCDILGLDRAMYNRRVHQLNDVQVRMVNLARALIVEPRLLLIDELEGGMSDEFITATMGVLKEYQKECQMAVILTTASEMIMQAADRILKIENYNLVEASHEHMMPEVR